jgi:L-alanine-DL-glutamate epimerase-like enolase superfamily enzyme
LDRAGGLTAAIELAHAATRQNIGIIVGASIGTSLSIAPATLLGGFAVHTDLDGALLLESDRKNAIRYDEWRVFPPPTRLWG